MNTSNKSKDDWTQLHQSLYEVTEESVHHMRKIGVLTREEEKQIMQIMQTACDRIINGNIEVEK